MSIKSDKTRKRPTKAKVKSNTITLGETTFFLKYTRSLPALTEQEFDDLTNDIASRGIIHYIIIDEYRNVIDGAHRLQVAEILGLTKIPILVIPGLSDKEKRQLAMDLNLNRRHLSPLEIAQVVKQHKERLPQLAVRLRQKGLSYRQIAEALGVSHPHVKKMIDKATGNGVTVELPENILGKDGKKRAARTKPKPLPAVNVGTVSEVQRATKACKTAGANKLPNKTLTLINAEKVAKKTVDDDLRNQDYEDLEIGRTNLKLGDFRKRSLEIPDSSVNLCFTDPLYKKDALPIWGDLGEVCFKKLKPGGLLVAYSGVMYLPEIHQMLGKHLEYLWTAAIQHTGRIKLVRSVQMFQAWKPILIYYKPPLRKYWRPFYDMVSGGEAKSNHMYEQAVDEAVHYIKALCPINGVLWDPMMGSATTIVAGLEADLGLTCIGCEIDKAAYATAEQRVKETIEKLESKRESA